MYDGTRFWWVEREHQSGEIHQKQFGNQIRKPFWRNPPKGSPRRNRTQIFFFLLLPGTRFQEFRHGPWPDHGSGGSLAAPCAERGGVLVFFEPWGQTGSPLFGSNVCGISWKGDEFPFCKNVFSLSSPKYQGPTTKNYFLRDMRIRIRGFGSWLLDVYRIPVAVVCYAPLCIVCRTGVFLHILCHRVLLCFLTP